MSGRGVRLLINRKKSSKEYVNHIFRMFCMVPVHEDTLPENEIKLEYMNEDGEWGCWKYAKD